METVGAEQDGVTRKQAEAELRERIVRVEQSEYRKPSALTFSEAADRGYASVRVSRAWKLSTASQCRHWALSESSYSSPASVNRRLTILRMILNWAKDSEYGLTFRGSSPPGFVSTRARL